MQYDSGMVVLQSSYLCTEQNSRAGMTTCLIDATWIRYLIIGGYSFLHYKFLCNPCAHQDFFFLHAHEKIISGHKCMCHHEKVLICPQCFYPTIREYLLDFIVPLLLFIYTTYVLPYAKSYDWNISKKQNHKSHLNKYTYFV